MRAHTFDAAQVAETLESDAAAKAAEAFVGLLIIRLLRGTDLPNMDLVGRTDAYAVFLLGDRKCRSKVVRNSLNPVWNETLSLNVMRALPSWACAPSVVPLPPSAHQLTSPRAALRRWVVQLVGRGGPRAPRVGCRAPPTRRTACLAPRPARDSCVTCHEPHARKGSSVSSHTHTRAMHRMWALADVESLGAPQVRSLKQSLILKLYDEDRFGADTFIGQALLPLEDLTHDGQPMGFDLSLQQISAPRRGGGGERASVAVEITYNPLNR